MLNQKLLDMKHLPTIPTRRWTVLLSSEQQKTYANAIRQGYFSTYDGYR